MFTFCQGAGLNNSKGDVIMNRKLGETNATAGDLHSVIR